MEITQTDLIVLAVLSGGPAHAWEIDRRLVAMGAALWAEYSLPHLYYSLRKLARAGLVEAAGKGGSTKQKPYQITTQGIKHLRKDKYLRSLAYSRNYFSFDLLLGFSEQFGSDGSDLLELLEERRRRLEEELEEAQGVWQKSEMSGNATFGQTALLKHRIKFLKGELDFLKWLEKHAPEGWASLSGRG